MNRHRNIGLISEEEFLPVLKRIAEDFFKLLNLIGGKPKEEWAKRHYALLSDKAHTLESTLDDYHARKNKTFSYLTELFASLKWFGYSAALQKHILIRFPQYALDVSEGLKTAFIADSVETLEWLHGAIVALLESLRKEAAGLKLEIPETMLEEIVDHDPLEQKYLPHNVEEEEEEIVDGTHMIAEVATRYRNLADALKKIRLNRDVEVAAIKSQTLYELDETKSRHYESLIHNIQSKYDTYIQQTTMESENPELKQLRGHTSLALHLFQIATILVHFYERHESDIRYEKMKKQISAIVPKEELLKVLHGYARYYGRKFFLEGEQYADRIIETFIKITTIEIIPYEDFTIHARPLSLIAKVALHYNTPLDMVVEERTCNASSITQMILIAGDNPRPKKIVFRGEARPLKDVKELFENRFFKEIDTVPHHLNYLFQ